MIEIDGRTEAERPGILASFPRSPARTGSVPSPAHKESSVHRPPSPRASSQGVIELLLMIILVVIVFLSILLIMGNDVQTLVGDLLSNWFPETAGGS